VITTTIVTVIAGIGLSIFSQYQHRAYLSTALSQGMNLRMAFEAALSDQGSLASTVFASNPALEFNIDGTTSCSGCSGDMTSLFQDSVIRRA
jgi:type II secretory pathway pseudopilin PulG